MVRPIKKILQRISTCVIRNRIDSGKKVYFKSLLEDLAFKFLPENHDNFRGRYYAKYYGQDEYEINPDSSSLYLAKNEGILISKQKYDKFHLIKSDRWNKKFKTLPYSINSQENINLPA